MNTATIRLFEPDSFGLTRRTMNMATIRLFEPDSLIAGYLALVVTVVIRLPVTVTVPGLAYKANKKSIGEA